MPRRLWRRERIQNKALYPLKHSTIWKSSTLCFLHSCVISNTAQMVISIPDFPCCLSPVNNLLDYLPPSCLQAAGGGIVSNAWTDQWIHGPGVCVLSHVGSTEITNEPTKMGIIRADTVKCMSFHYQDTNLWIPFTACNQGSDAELINCEAVHGKKAAVTGQ